MEFSVTECNSFHDREEKQFETLSPKTILLDHEVFSRLQKFGTCLGGAMI